MQNFNFRFEYGEIHIFNHPACPMQSQAERFEDEYDVQMIHGLSDVNTTTTIHQKHATHRIVCVPGASREGMIDINRVTYKEIGQFRADRIVPQIQICQSPILCDRTLHANAR